MRNELKHIEEIENYLLGKCTIEEKKAFESKMKNDPAFSEDVELQKKLTERIALAAFITDVKAFNPDLALKTSLTQSGSWFLNSIIAMVVTGAAVLGYFWFTSDTENKITGEDTGNSQEESSQNTPDNTDLNVTLASNDTSGENEEPVDMTFSPAENRNRIQNHNSGNDRSRTGDTGKSTATGDDIQTSVADMNPLPVVIEPVQQKNKLLRNLQVPFDSIIMNAEVDKTFSTRVSKSVVYIPGGIMVYEDGTPVKGLVTVKFREFRNAAEMAFAEIPMTHKQNGEEFYFNSAGMIELRAYQGKREIRIANQQNYYLNYKMTQKLDSCYFWSLDDAEQKWKKESGFNYNQNSMTDSRMENANDYNEGAVLGTVIKASDSSKITPGQNFYLEKNFELFAPKKLRYYAQYNDSGYIFQFLPVGKYTAHYISDVHRKMKIRGVKVKAGKYTQLDLALANANDKDLKSDYSMAKSATPFPTYKDSSSGAEVSMINAYFKNTGTGKMNPKLADGLACAGFGVFNCDQLSRLSQKVNIRASYSDSNNEPIKLADDAILSMIDLNINGAFQFNPDAFTCSVSGKTVLFLLNDNRIYTISKEDFNKMNITRSGNYTFRMTDITEQVNSVQDLKTILKL